MKIGDIVVIENIKETHNTYPIEELTDDIQVIKKFAYGSFPKEDDWYKVYGIYHTALGSKMKVYLISKGRWDSPYYIVNEKAFMKNIVGYGTFIIKKG